MGRNWLLLPVVRFQRLLKWQMLFSYRQLEETSYRSEALSSRIAQLAIIDAIFVIVMFHDENCSNESLKKIRHAIAITKDSI